MRTKPSPPRTPTPHSVIARSVATHSARRHIFSATVQVSPTTEQAFILTSLSGSANFPRGHADRWDVPTKICSSTGPTSLTAANYGLASGHQITVRFFATTWATARSGKANAPLPP